MYRRFFLSLWLLAFGVKAQAQLLPEPAGPDSVRNAFFPVAGYSSDVGLMGGAIYNRYDYSGNTRPFNSYLQSAAVISTKGFIKLEGLYEKTNAFDSDLRSTNEVYLFRRAYNTFFGVGNNTTYSDRLWEEEYYFFESVSFGVDLRLRKPLYVKERRRFDLVGGVGGEYYYPDERLPNSSFSRISPPGSEGGYIHFLTGGFVWENRDREFDPRNGNRGEFELRVAPGLISKYTMAAFRADFRQYFYIFDFLTIANRLQGEHVTGDVPFWELPALGDDYTLRGYPLYRFRGNSSVVYNLELRSWMFTFPEYRIKLGVQLFTDMGRVFTPSDRFEDLFRGYKQTFGFGGALSLFSPDFILRGDIGYSEEVSRIYIGVGYTF